MSASVSGASCRPALTARISCSRISSPSARRRVSGRRRSRDTAPCVPHGRPASIPLLPSGSAHIEPRGRDTISIGGRMWTLARYSVSGVLWGRETLWTDDSGKLDALVSVDAEFDHFEAVRPELEDAVPQLVARAASDGMAAMAETAAAVLPQPSPSIAITGGTVIDVEGKRRPLANATVIVTGGT